MTVLVVSALVLAVVTAARSTWSPCGLSMLSTITPFTESARGNRYPVTAAWFVTGAVFGGLTLGAALAVGAAGVAAAGLSSAVLAVLAILMISAAIGSDLRLGGFRLPAHRRQVDEVWLTGFRPWVYGLGFGWQIGVGLATYVTTAAVYVVCVLAVLTANPLAALVVGTVFGTVRGLAVLLGRRVTTPEALRRLHARLESLDVRAANLTVAAMVAVLVAITWTMSAPAALVLAAATLSVGLVLLSVGCRPVDGPSSDTTSRLPASRGARTPVQ